MYSLPSAQLYIYCCYTDDSTFISTLQDKLQRKAVTLVWYLPLLNNKTLNQITKFILEDTLKVDITIYLMQIVNER